MNTIVSVKRDSNGAAQAYKFDDGSVMDKEQAINAVESNQLENYVISTAKDGTKSLRTKPDGSLENNLSNLPTF